MALRFLAGTGVKKSQSHSSDMFYMLDYSILRPNVQAIVWSPRAIYLSNRVGLSRGVNTVQVLEQETLLLEGYVGGGAASLGYKRGSCRHTRVSRQDFESLLQRIQLQNV